MESKRVIFPVLIRVIQVNLKAIMMVPQPRPPPPAAASARQPPRLRCSEPPASRRPGVALAG